MFREVDLAARRHGFESTWLMFLAMQEKEGRRKAIDSQ